MRKLIVQEFITIDGFAATESNGLDFMPKALPVDTENSVEQNQWQFVDTIDTMLIGHNTYEMFVNYWPLAVERIAGKLNALTKIVCSTTLDTAPWGNHTAASVIQRDTAQRVGEIKKQAGKHIVIWGSIQLVHSLLHTGLIDEFQLIVCPAVIGKGKPLFPATASLQGLQLAGTKTMDGGFVLLQYNTSH